MRRFTTSQRGNVFFALFGAVAFVGVLGAATMSFVKGPLKTSVTVSRLSVAETQMQVGAQMAVLQASSEADSGDCDADGYVEPMEFKVQADDALRAVDDAGTGGVGGNLPDTLGATKQDPWGRLYAYCVWNSGANSVIDSVGACDDDSSGNEERIAGSPYEYDVVMAIISAGPDRTFQTKCLTFDQADNNSNGVLGDSGDEEMVYKPSGSDDIINAFTYAEAATVGGGGLWSIKSSDPGTATIDKAIEFSGGLSMGTQAVVTTCGTSTANIMRYNTFTDEIQVCDGAGNWEAAAGGDTSTFDDDNSVPCDMSIQGQVRYNTTSSLPEFCDGTGWRAFNISATTSPELILSPTSANSMDVDGTDNKDATLCTSPMYCGDELTFTLQNVGATDSDPVAWSFADSTNFVVSSEDCTGEVLSQMESCSINVRPRANGNESYATRLNVSVNNAPFSVLQGEATGFGCSPGFSGGGGVYIACGVNDGDGLHNLVLNESGCDGSTTEPVCSGTDPITLARPWGPTFDVSEHACTGTSCNPAEGHVALIAYQNASGELFAAANYCDTLVHNGYSDWFLPSREHYDTQIYPKKSAGTLTGFSNSSYWMSRAASGSTTNYVNMSNGETWRTTSKASNLRVRCVRRETLPMPTAPTDATPNLSNFIPVTTTTSGDRIRSSTTTILGIFDPISISISAPSGSPAIIYNGTDVGTSITNVVWGDTIAIEMTAPTVDNTVNTADITIGGELYTWDILYLSSLKTALVFTTNWNGRVTGGINSVDAKCKEEAARASGLPGQWVAIASTTGLDASERLPRNWNIMETVTGKRIVSNGLTDLFDGTLENGIDIDQFGNIVGGEVRTATNEDGERYSTTANQMCSNWTFGSSSQSSRVGLVGSVDKNWTNFYSDNCFDGKRLYCVEDTSASDTTIFTFDLPPALHITPGSRYNTSTVSVGGMTSGTTQTMSVSASGGTPTFTVNGGSEVTSATVENGDEIIFYLTAPATPGEKREMTITAGSVTDSLKIFSGASVSTVKRVFVTDTVYSGNFGGVVGADTRCQTSADNESLGGTWKAIISGIGESEYAFNRVGYNWTELQLVDGTTVVYAPNLWEAETTPLLSPIILSESGASIVNGRTYTNTLSNGNARSTSNDTSSNCNNWTSSSSNTVGNLPRGNTSSTSSNWTASTMAFSINRCSSSGNTRLYCIEQ